MNQLKRRLPSVLLTFVLLASPAWAVHAEPAAGAAARDELWTSRLLAVLDDLLGGLWSIEAASEDDGSVQPIDSTDDGGTGYAPTWDPNGGSSALTTTRYAPTWDPNG